MTEKNVSTFPHGAKHAPGSGPRSHVSQSWRGYRQGRCPAPKKWASRVPTMCMHSNSLCLKHACCFTFPFQKACRFPREPTWCKEGDSRQCYFQFSWYTAKPPQITIIMIMITNRYWVLSTRQAQVCFLTALLWGNSSIILETFNTESEAQKD